MLLYFPDAEGCLTTQVLMDVIPPNWHWLQYYNTTQVPVVRIYPGAYVYPTTHAAVAVLQPSSGECYTTKVLVVFVLYLFVQTQTDRLSC